jgi:hypothetical protein
MNASTILGLGWLDRCDQDAAAGIKTPSILEVAFQAIAKQQAERDALIESWRPDQQWQWRKYGTGPWLNLKKGVRPNFWPEQDYRPLPPPPKD